MLDEEEVEAAAARLNELVVENGYHIDCGILGNKYIYRALSDFGYGETLYRMVTNPTCPSYAWWMDQGMTTLCEDWEMTISLNHHMYSEVDLWFYPVPGGHPAGRGPAHHRPPVLAPAGVGQSREPRGQGLLG